MPLRIKEKAVLPKNSLLLTLIIGLIVGIFLANIIGSSYLSSNASLISGYYMNKYAYLTPDYGRLFVYVFNQRIIPVLYLCLFGMTMFGLVVVYGYVFWYGFSAGMLLSLFSIQYGMRGILFCIIAIMPQYILYIPAFVLLIHIVYQLTMELYFKKSYTGKNFNSKKQIFFSCFLQLLLIILCMIIGVILETYVNTYLLKKIINIL